MVGTHGASAVAALIRGSDFQISADVDLSRFRIADNLLLRHMTHIDIGSELGVGELHNRKPNFFPISVHYL